MSQIRKQKEFVGRRQQYRRAKNAFVRTIANCKFKYCIIV